MSTYCYAHGLVEEGCVVCEAKVARMLRGEYPYRKGISIARAYADYFPQVRSADR